MKNSTLLKILGRVGLRVEQYAQQNGITENNLRQWLEEDKDATFGKLSMDTMALQFNIEKTIVFKNKNINIELREGFDKQYLKQIVEVLINDK